jgi:hypothetical protein
MFSAFHDSKREKMGGLMQPLRRRLVEPHGKLTRAPPKACSQRCVSLGPQLRLEQRPQLRLGPHARHPQPLWAQLPQHRSRQCVRHPQPCRFTQDLERCISRARRTNLAALSYVTAVSQTSSTLDCETSRKLTWPRPTPTTSRRARPCPRLRLIRKVN